eukprot:TRINITY_DN55028_c0_g1_i1.p1 TRINITY_DN55028_c0_g1~~TRINITY_DN55028_c0_g1_i1.p1  ORF type:complete len:625 (+),score=168.33 TRINITY_DN55028_c0_g1_i1:119-1876(+)
MAAGGTSSPSPPSPPLQRSGSGGRPRAFSVAAAGEGLLSHAVLDDQGKRHMLLDVWKSRRIVAVFLRHVGCRFCRQLTAGALTLRSRLRELAAADESVEPVEVVLFTLSAPADIAPWRELTGWDGEVYVDPDPFNSKIHRFFDLLRQDNPLADPRVVEAAKAASAEGFADGDAPWRGDIAQVGGVFVVGPGITCDYAFRSQFAGHHPSLDEVLQKASGMVSDGTPLVYPTTQKWIGDLAVERRVPSPVAAGAAPAQRRAPRRRRGLLDRLPVPAAIACLVIAVAAAALPAAQVCAVGLLAGVAAMAAAWALADPPIPRTPVYSLGQIDRLALEHGIDECDCGFIGGVDVETHVPAKGHKPERIVTASGSKKATDHLETMLQLGCYVREFLAKPNHLVGRKGSTCPFIPTALRRDTVFMCCVFVTAEHSVDDVKDIVRRYVAQFENFQPTSGTAALYRTLLICFPLIPLELCGEYIDRVQFELKGEVLKKGMMIGENHLHNNGQGLHNEWYPLRTPHPTLALRHMVPGDLVFLTPGKYPIEVRHDFIGSFVRTFETPEGRRRVSDKQLQFARDELAQIESEMKTQG